MFKVKSHSSFKIPIVDASTNELNPLVCITFILTAYHARNDTEDG